MPKKKPVDKKPHATPANRVPQAKCGALAKSSGKPCIKAAGWRTDHPGVGKCYLHGGNTPITHGRYSAIKRTRLADLIAKFEADPEPLNILPEVMLLRALITDYVERYDEFTDALVAWHESYSINPKMATAKPTQVIDILSAAKFIGQIGSLVERIEKQKQEGVVSLEAVNRYVEQLGMEAMAAAQEAIPDANSRSALLAALDRRWQSVVFDTASKPRRGRSSEGSGES